jgi:hypothetical protein
MDFPSSFRSPSRRYSTINVAAFRSFRGGQLLTEMPNNAHAVVHDTEVVTAIKDNVELPSHRDDMAELERHAKNTHGGTSAYDDELRARLSKAVFVGHINTDLDSVAGAIAAATLFGGTPALADPLERLNGEITFALDNTGIEPPAYFSTLENANDCDVCLVDHTEEKQMVPTLRDCPNRIDRIIGVIDHHALAKSFSSTRPVYMDLRPCKSGRESMLCLLSWPSKYRTKSRNYLHRRGLIGV